MAHDIKIRVEELTLDTIIGSTHDDGPLTLADAIVSAAARELAGSADYEPVRVRIRQIRTEEIRATVAKEIEAALVDPVTPTNQWGETTGETTTLRAEIARLAKEAVQPRRRDSYGEPSAVERVIRDEVDRALARELSAKVVAAVRAKAAELIAQAVKEGVGR